MLRSHRRSNPCRPASRLWPLTTPPTSCLCPNKIFVLAILCPSNFEMSIRDPKRIQMKKLSIIARVQLPEIWNFGQCSTFVFIWQLVFNHGLIRLKTFVSQFPTKLCNQFFFRLYLMLHARIARFDVMTTVALFRNLGWELNTRIKFYNFLRSTTFILVVSPSEVIYKI